MTGTITIQVGGHLRVEGALVEIRELRADVIVLRADAAVRAPHAREMSGPTGDRHGREAVVSRQHSWRPLEPA